MHHIVQFTIDQAKLFGQIECCIDVTSSLSIVEREDADIPWRHEAHPNHGSHKANGNVNVGCIKTGLTLINYLCKAPSLES